MAGEIFRRGEGRIEFCPFHAHLVDVGEISAQRAGPRVDDVGLKVPHSGVVDVEVQQQSLIQQAGFDA
jgi:hypothetical protein